MQVYSVTLNTLGEESATQAKEIIRDHFESNFILLNDNQILIRTNGMDATQLSKVLGMWQDDPEKVPSTLGVIFRLSPHYHGFWEKQLWEWLEDAFKDRL